MARPGRATHDSVASSDVPWITRPSRVITRVMEPHLSRTVFLQAAEWVLGTRASLSAKDDTRERIGEVERGGDSGGDAMVADLKAQVFKELEFRALVVKDGKREVTLM